MTTTRKRAHTLLAVVYTLWIAYEAYMAVKLKTEISTTRDYAALTIKLSYLTLALALLLSNRDPLKNIPLITPYAIATLRLLGSWLSYSWYTILAPTLATLMALPRIKNAGREEKRLLTTAVAGNTLLALLMLPGLITNLYNPPAKPEAPALAAIPLLTAYTIALALLKSHRQAP